MVDCEVTTGSPDVSVIERRATDGGEYLFVRTNQHDAPCAGTVHLKENGGAAELAFSYQLEPFGSKVLYLAPGVSDPTKGEWLPKVEASPKRPTDLPAAIAVSDVQSLGDAGHSDWRPAGGKSLNELGVYDSRFVYFHTTLTVTAQDLKSEAGLELVVEHPSGDAVVAAINGQRLRPVQGSGNGAFVAQPALHAGENDVLMLYENVGTPNGGIGMEKRAGISHVHLAAGTKADAELSGWRMKVVARNAQVDQLAETAADFQDDAWTPVKAAGREAAQLKARQDAVFRTTVQVSAADIKAGRTAFTFTRVDDKGTAFVNGQKIGEAEDWNQTYTFDAAKQLHVGANSLAVFVHNADGGGGLGGVMLTDGAAPGVGTVGEISYADVAPERIEADVMPNKMTESPSLVTKERLAFALPEVRAGVWVPWLLRVHATGNGFLYLNGHPLGRYWQAGQQKDFYLPECWLNLGGKNVVAISLREVDKPVGVESAEVIPYSVYAEYRP